MGKSSRPSYSTGTISINGVDKVITRKDGDNVISDYKMSKAEQQAYDYAQKQFAKSLSKVNVFDKNTQKNLNAQVKAYKKNGQKLIAETYEPVLDNLKSDIASRFGNFDNSIFMDKLNSIESKRAEAMSSLAQDVTAKQNELVKNELLKRYTYLEFLQDVQNQANSNMLNVISASLQNSKSGNDYNTGTYGSNNGSSQFADYANLAKNMFSFW